MVLRTYLLVLSLVLSSCAIGPQRTESDPSMPLGGSTSGVVIGRICKHGLGTGITVLNLLTKEETKYIGAIDFSLRLPEGDYALYTLGSTRGVLSSRTPFLFQVRSGEVRYIGTFQMSWSPEPDCRKPVAPVSAKPYQHVYRGPLGTSQELDFRGPVYELLLVDDSASTEGEFRRTFPAYASSTIVRALAR